MTKRSFIAMAALLACARWSAADITAISEGGNWSNPNNWVNSSYQSLGTYPENGNPPGALYDVSGGATLDISPTIQTYTLSNATDLWGPGTLTIDGLFTFSDGNIHATVQANGGIAFSGFSVINGDTLTNNPGSAATLGANDDLVFDASPSGTPAVFNNAGTFTISGDGAQISCDNTPAAFNNTGTFTLQLANPSYSCTISNGIAINNSGTFDVKEGLVFAENYTQTAGKTILDGGNISTSGVDALDFKGGTITGSGEIEGYATLEFTATLESTLGGETPGTGYDKIQIDNAITLAGDLDIDFANNFQNTISPTDTFTVLIAPNPFVGKFANAVNGQRLETTDGFGSFLVNYDYDPASHQYEVVLSDFLAAAPEPGALALLPITVLFTGVRKRPR